jgi:hypothetical protein
LRIEASSRYPKVLDQNIKENKKEKNELSSCQTLKVLDWLILRELNCLLFARKCWSKNCFTIKTKD